MPKPLIRLNHCVKPISVSRSAGSPARARSIAVACFGESEVRDVALPMGAFEANEHTVYVCIGNMWVCFAAREFWDAQKKEASPCV